MKKIILSLSMRLRSIILVLVSFSGSAHTCDSLTSPYLTQALQQANLALEEKQPQEALNILLKASKWMGDNSHHSLEFHLGVQLVQAGFSDKALPHFRSATQLCPSFVPAWQNLGRTAFDTGYYLEAADALDKAFQLTDATRTDLRYFQALALYKAEKWSQSFKLLSELFNNHADKAKLDWAELIAVTASNSNRQPEAISILLKQNARFEGFARFKRVLINLMLQQHRYELALIQLKGLDYLTELTDAELMTLGDLFRMQSLPLDAAHCYHRLAKRGQASASLLQKEVESLITAYQSTRALELINNGVMRWNSEPLWRLAAQLRLDAEQHTSALEAFKKLLEFSPNNSEAQMMIGYILFLQEKPDAAVTWLNKAANEQHQAITLRDYIMKNQELTGSQRTEPSASDEE